MSRDDEPPDEDTPAFRSRPPLRMAAVVRRPTHPAGVPTDYEDPIDTGVFDLLDRDPSDEEAEIVRRSRRRSDAPLTVEDGAKLLRYIRRQATKAEESGQRRQLAQLEQVLRRPPREIADALVTEVAQLRAEVAGMRPDVQTVGAIKKRFLAWLGVGAITTLAAVGCWLYSRGGDERAVQMRLDALEKAVERLTRVEDRERSRTP
ncbi:MAG TPA: hypothetical protein VFQ42_22250 [Mycobacterium sp.]|nr:hypothetical protein [Mycobacterium sp.]